MKKLALIGSGGFAKEVKASIGDFNLTCFVNDVYYQKNDNNIFPLSQFDPSEYRVAIAIGDPDSRKKIVENLPPETEYFTHIHKSAQILGNDVEIGEGSIICAGSIITTNCTIGKHSHLNILSSIGHDCRIGDFFTCAPGAKVSGNCSIGNIVYVGTNASIKQKIEICDRVTIGSNAGVVKNIVTSGIYVGVPAKILEK